jgi:glutathione S-transferase
MKLVIGTPNHSSWTMRIWIVMRCFEIAFDEIKVSLNQPATADQIGQYSPSGRIPCLLVGQQVIWDSLAICEYLAESFPERSLWPADPMARAHARSICGEMHADFHEMRHSMPFNIRARKVAAGAKALGINEVRRDVRRIDDIWEACLEQYSGPYLFGNLSIADAYFSPVILRFRSYGVAASSKRVAQYMTQIESLKPIREWIAAASQE